MQVWPGTAYPLGATWDGSGTNFALFSEVADRVELCLFGGEGTGTAGGSAQPTAPAGEQRIELTEVDGFVWHCYLPGIGPGQRYGYRVHGPYDPGAGHRCNPAKLLLDPYGKAVEGGLRWNEALFSYRFGDPASLNADDSAPFMPRSVVINPYFDWADDRPPRTPVPRDADLRGARARPDPAPPRRAAGAARQLRRAWPPPPIIDHLTRLGVTAVELMPVHQFVPEQRLVERGPDQLLGLQHHRLLRPAQRLLLARPSRTARWPSSRRWSGRCTSAGIEVILDVVYNHTAEGGALGPDAVVPRHRQRRLLPARRRRPGRYLDYTGCGNSLNVRHPHALQLIMDSLRYWVIEMHVDGFRFDLASALARELHEVDRLATFFELVQQDPVVSQVKLIAEPWDVGEGGYQVGKFPPLWSEWNGKYRDTVRDFWRGQPATLPEFASRLTGSSDLYETSARRPVASVNFVTCHDGFTLADLVSYDGKHNEANGEQQRRRHRRQPVLELRRRGAGRRPGHHRAARPAGPQLPGHAVLLAGRADAAGRRRAGPDPARQQQRLLPGQRDLLGGLGGRQQARRPAGVHPRRWPSCAATHPVFRRRRFFSGQPAAGDAAGCATSSGWRRRASR